MVELVHERGLLIAAPVVFPSTGSVEGAVVAVLLASRTTARRIITPLTRLTDIAHSQVRQSRLDLRAPAVGRDGQI